MLISLVSDDSDMHASLYARESMLSAPISRSQFTLSIAIVAIIKTARAERYSILDEILQT